MDTIEFTVGADTTLTIPGEDISVSGRLAIWDNGQDAIVAGWAYPAENYAKNLEKSLTEAIDLTLEIDLGLDPGASESALRTLIQSIPDSAHNPIRPKLRTESPPKTQVCSLPV